MNKEEQWKNMEMIEEYFDRTKHYIKEYGERTIVLMQCGTFMEVYAYRNEGDCEYYGSNLPLFAKVTHASIVQKSKTKVNGINRYLHLAGVRVYQRERYVDALVDADITVVVFLQHDESLQCETGSNKKSRYIEGIYSPGTHTSPETNTDFQWSNNLMSVWIERVNMKSHKKDHVFGISVLNNITGETFMNEYETSEYQLQTTQFNELERCLSVYSPREIIIVTDDQEISKYLTQLKSFYKHIYGSDISFAKNATDLAYQRHILDKYFGKESMNLCNEFQSNPISVQSLCVMLNFVEEHNPSLVKRIRLPMWENQTIYTTLQNHTLVQLDILKYGKEYNHRHGSVHKWLNRCKTVMGKRLFLQKLTHPIYDRETLEKGYDTIDQFLQNPCYSGMIDSLRKVLDNVNDIESLSGFIVSKRLPPSGIHKLYSSVQNIEQILTCIYDMSWLHEFLGINDKSRYSYMCNEITSYISRRFNMTECTFVNQCSGFSGSILNRGVYSELDEMYSTHENSLKDLKGIQTFLERKMSSTSKVGEYVKYNQTESNKITLQMTKKRCETLQTNMNKNPEKSKIVINENISIDWKEVSFVNSSKKNNMDISFPYCDKLCASVGRFHTESSVLTQKLYSEIMKEMEDRFLDYIHDLSSIVSLLDVLLSNCYMAKKYHYARPEIEDHETSFVEAKDLRHILIEQINDNEIYVPNDVSLGKDRCGMLLYGTNAVGKTSYMRSIGVAVILAQSGMFVPCSRFVFNPYKAIYSRILNQDNLFKGLSTFMVEMSELRVIINYADKNSLILGDELCSGTEKISALSLIMSSLKSLHNRNSSFLFATHFHEIVDFPELAKLPKLDLCHLAVHYDAQKDVLVYNRKLQEGPGPCNYGLEVCKSLYFPQEFLDDAFTIRKTHFPEYQGTLTKRKTTYNAKKIKDKCEKCQKEGTEIHHKYPQKDADSEGYIDNRFHKNHMANLQTLCEECHLKMHQEEEKPKRKIVKRKTDDQLRIKATSS